MGCSWWSFILMFGRTTGLTLSLSARWLIIYRGWLENLWRGFGVVRNDLGQFFAAFARHIYKNGNNMAQIRAIHEGLTLVHNFTMFGWCECFGISIRRLIMNGCLMWKLQWDPFSQIFPLSNPYIENFRRAHIFREKVTPKPIFSKNSAFFFNSFPVTSPLSSLFQSKNKVFVRSEMEVKKRERWRNGGAGVLG